MVRCWQPKVDMPVEMVPGTGGAPRRARYLIPTQLPRRGEVVAACAVVLLALHLVFAQLTLVLAVLFAVIGRASRWRLSWLAVPAAAGLTWTLAIGPDAAAQGFAAGPAHILGYLSAHGLLHLHGAFAGAGSWMPRQAPLALLAASAEAAAAGWLSWLHTDEWAVPPPRPGLLAAARRAAVTRAIRSGRVVTRDGASLGVALATGARAALSWTETAAGVLFTGAAACDVTVASFQVVHAALRLRKPVIVLDLSGDPATGSALAAACAATGTPLRTFGAGENGSGCYEPFRAGDAARRTALTLAMLGGAAGALGAEAVLRGAFELITQVPAGPGVPVLDDVSHLLNPAAMRARLGLIAHGSPAADQVTRRVRDAARQARAAPEAVARLASELESVRKSPAGQWLRPPGHDHAGIDLGRVVRERSAVLFQPDTPAIARLVCADLLALGEDLRAISVDGDAIVLACGCDRLAGDSLGRLVAAGESAGLSVVATTTSEAFAAEHAGTFGTVAILRLAGSGARPAAGHGAGDGQRPDAVLAARTGTRLRPLAAGARPAASVREPFLVPAPVRGTAAPAVVSPGRERDVPGPLPSPPAPPPLPLPGAPASGTAPVPPAAGCDLVPEPAVPAQRLLSLRAGQFVLSVRSPAPRLVELAQVVPARLPRDPRPRAAGSPP
jgi:hypothetical protein